MFVIPVKGRKVPDPRRGDFLPEKGRNVEKYSYWLRRLMDGDVKETSQKKGD
ncbi:DUF2635 domain-containing protein [Cronobacter sakazakii]|nr:DUF2635 domain-containing protein [Cronobacter sakazakii]